MITIKIAGPITDAEFELLTHMGTIEDCGSRETDGVTFSFPPYLTFLQLIALMEDAIVRQESDQGDWLRAKEYREAKPILLTKIRQAVMTAVPNA